MSRRTALIVLAIASIALATVLTVIDPANEADGNPSIIDYELAWSEERAEEIQADWGDEGEDAARLSLLLDYLYLLVYGGFLVLAVAATRDLAAERGFRRLAALGGAATIAAFAAPLADAVENAWLLVGLVEEGGIAPILGGGFATVKFAATLAAIAYLVAGLVARLRARKAQA